MTEVMQIHCPSCGVRLGIPGDTGGRMARCPQCNHKFRVPDPRAMLDDTVTCWLNLDQIDDDERADDFRKEVDLQRTAMGMNPPDEDKARPEEPEAQAPEPVVPQPPKPKPKRRVLRKRGGPAASDEPVETPSKPAADQPQAESSGKTAFAMEVNQNPVSLSVVNVSSAGVRFAFSSRLLDLPQFRASMPMCDVYSADYNCETLTVRPLAWIDKATGKFNNPGELEARYEMKLKQHHTPREVLGTMRIMDELPSPFCQPMPYYVKSGSSKPIHCESYQTPKGIVCEVTIPSAVVALEWLGRVNGVCCPEYAELEERANKLEASAWRAIPEKVRKRLSAWFDFEGEESFLAYFNDGDFAASDAGLAGLIVTTKRLAYCKYHANGVVAHDKAVTLVAIESGRFVTLVKQGSGGTKRIIKLKTADLDELVALLDQVNSNLELVVQEGAIDD